LNEALRVINTDIPAAHQQLDQLAAALVDTVNEVHSRGFRPLDGTSGNDFFDSSGVTAATIGLHQDIVDSTAGIASSGVTGQATNNTIAAEMAALRDRADVVTLPTGQTTFGGAYRSMISGIAQQTRTAEESATVFQTLVAQTDTRRAAVSGVSVDEELISLMQH